MQIYSVKAKKNSQELEKLHGRNVLSYPGTEDIIMTVFKKQVMAGEMVLAAQP